MIRICLIVLSWTVISIAYPQFNPFHLNQQGFQNQFPPNQQGGFPGQQGGFPSQQGVFPSQQQQNNQQGSQQQQGTTATSITSSPAFLTCTQIRCITTNQYNPVCGSDQIVYTNQDKLNCANQCGRELNPNWQEITVQRVGACTSGQRVS